MKGGTRAVALGATSACEAGLEDEIRRRAELPGLLENFDAIAQAEGGLTKLRQLVLDLAIRGLLVEQSPGSAGVNVGDLAKSSGYPLDDEATPFDLPPAWAWSRLGAISAEVRYGYTASARAERKGTRLLRITDIQNDRVSWSNVPGCDIDADEVPAFRLHDGDLVIARTGGTIGKTYLVEGLTVQAVFASYLIRVAPLPPILPRYLKAYSGSGLYWSQLHAGAAGTGQPNVNATTLKSLFVPIPPAEEQKRIVAKVDQLMALCDDLEARQAKKRDTNRRLTKSALESLASAEGPGEFDAAWKMVIENFDVIVGDSNSVPPLRNTILSLATLGRLVAAVDGSPPDVPTGYTYEPEFVVPGHWRWAPLGKICRFIDYRGKTPRKTTQGVRLITAKNVRMGTLRRDPEEFIAEADYDGWMTRGLPQKGDVLFTTEAPLGNVAQLGTDERVAMAQRIITMRPITEVDPTFLKMILMSPLLQNAILRQATGMTATGIKAAKLKLIPIPIPPLLEQRRIVDRIEGLLATCQKVELHLSRVEDHAARLAEAMVQEFS